MTIGNHTRRSFVKLLAAAPLLSQILVRDLYAQAATALGKNPHQNVYTRLGVKTIINCRGTWTYLSGSLEFPEVRQAQLEAAQYFVNMLELQRAVGRRLSELTGAESESSRRAPSAQWLSRPPHAWQVPRTRISGSFPTRPV
jgi:L-seryl-tRNA(Ser) seleniumtransferase